MSLLYSTLNFVRGLIDDKCVFCFSIICSMNPETAATFTCGHFNQVHCKKWLVVLTTEWLPWLQTCKLRRRWLWEVYIPNNWQPPTICDYNYTWKIWCFCGYYICKSWLVSGCSSIQAIQLHPFHRCSVVAISAKSWLQDSLGSYLHGCLMQLDYT